jgi:phosphatidate phosphatase APP1
MTDAAPPPRRLLRIADSAERKVDAIKDRLANRFDRDDPVQILAYRGYGSADWLLAEGRVLQDEPLGESSKGDSIWKNIGNTWKRFESDEVKGARVRARFGGWEGEAVTNEEGYFRFDIRPLERPDPGKLWHGVELTLLEPSFPEPVRAVGAIMVPPPDARFGIISDIDDTVVETGVTRRLAMARTVFLRNAHTRLPFKGVAAFYAALHEEREGQGPNPIFFVSGSPWNLYDLLAEFMDLHHIPQGPLRLKDFGLDPRKLLKTDTREHKLGCIEPIFDLYPHLRFILIGDSGEKDPEIYREVVRRHPGRVLAVYIRDVGNRPGREAQVQALAAEIESEGIPMLLVKDTVAAAVHAAERGWIDPGRLPDVREEKRKDEVAPSPVEVMMKPEAAKTPEG